MRQLRGLALLASLWIVPFAWADFPMVRDAAVLVETVDATGHQIPNPISTVAGDLVIVLISTDASAGAVTHAWPSSTYCVGDTWTALQADTTDASGLHTSAIRYCILDAAMSGTETVTSTNSETSSLLTFVIAKDTFTGTPVAGTPVTSVGTTAMDPPNNAGFGGGAVDTMWIVTGTTDGNSIVRLVTAGPDLTFAKLVSSGAVAGAGPQGVGLAWRNLNATSLNPGTNVILSSSATANTSNTLAVQGATPAGGGGGGGTGPKIF